MKKPQMRPTLHSKKVFMQSIRMKLVIRKLKSINREQCETEKVLNQKNDTITSFALSVSFVEDDLCLPVFIIASLICCK